MPCLKVDGLAEREWGNSIVRLHIENRNGAEPYDIIRITSKEDATKTCDVMVLDNSKKDVIYMDRYTRDKLNVEKGQEIFRFKEPKKLNFIEKYLWYLKSQDPRVHVPAYLAIWSIALGLIGVILGAGGIGLGICALWTVGP